MTLHSTRRSANSAPQVLREDACLMMMIDSNTTPFMLHVCARRFGSCAPASCPPGREKCRYVKTESRNSNCHRMGDMRRWTTPSVTTTFSNKSKFEYGPCTIGGWKLAACSRQNTKTHPLGLYYDTNGTSSSIPPLSHSFLSEPAAVRRMEASCASLWATLAISVANLLSSHTALAMYVLAACLHVPVTC